MPIFTIQTPGGKKLRIEAADEATALSGAQQWAAQNEAQSHPAAERHAPGTMGAATPPPDLKPGTREYADWAAEQARAGKTLPQVSNPKLTETESSILDPFVQGVTFGWGDEMRGAVQGGIAALQGGDFGSTYDQVVDESRNALEHERRVNPVGSFAAEVAGALPTGIGLGGQIAGRGATLGARALTGGGVAATQGAAYGAGSSDHDRVGGAALGFGLGAGIGAAAPYIGQAARRVVTPNPAAPAQTAAARTLADEGITLTAGQKTGNKKLQYLESELGGARVDDLMEQQAEQFTSAALKRAGIPAKRATPEVIDRAFSDLGRQFDDMATITQTPFDSRLQNDLLGVVTDYLDNAGTPAPGIERMLNRISEVAKQNGGQLSGRAFQTLRSELGRLIRSADGPTKMALRDMQEALDEAVERNLGGQTREAWQNLRRQYKNLLVIERAATGAGANAAAGLLSPAQLRNAAINQNRRAFARGTNDFTDLANAAVRTMTPLPQSGTAPRLAARAITNLPGMIGAVAGTPGGLPGMIAGGLAGAAVPALTGRALLSRPGMAFLSNQVATGTGTGIVEEAVRRSATPIAGRR